MNRLHRWHHPSLQDWMDHSWSFMIIPPKQQWSNGNLNIFFSIAYEFMWYMNIIWYEYHVNILKPCILIFDSSNLQPVSRYLDVATWQPGMWISTCQALRRWVRPILRQGNPGNWQPPYPSHWKMLKLLGGKIVGRVRRFSDNFLTFYFWIFLMSILTSTIGTTSLVFKVQNLITEEGMTAMILFDPFGGPRNANLRDLPITAGNTVGVALGAIDLGCSCQVQQIKYSTCGVRGSFRNRSFCWSSPQLGGIRELVMILNLASLLILSLLLKEASSQSSLQDVFCSGWNGWSGGSVKLLLGTLLLRLQYASQSAVYRVCTVPTRDSQDCFGQRQFWMNGICSYDFTSMGMQGFFKVVKHRCICRGRDSWIPVRSPLILEKGFPTEITWHVSIRWATAGSAIFHPLPHAACLAVSKSSHYLWWNDVKFMFSWRFLIFIPMVDARCWCSVIFSDFDSWFFEL